MRVDNGVKVQIFIDCEQSLFFSVSHAHERARREKRGWQPEKKKSLSRLASSVMRVCILARFVRWTKKKERLLVV